MVGGQTFRKFGCLVLNAETREINDECFDVRDPVFSAGNLLAKFVQVS